MAAGANVNVTSSTCDVPVGECNARRKEPGRSEKARIVEDYGTVARMSHFDACPDMDLLQQRR